VLVVEPFDEWMLPFIRRLLGKKQEQYYMGGQVAVNNTEQRINPWKCSNTVLVVY